ncbi:ParB/RepB/Spo0J family partition protein [Pseudomonadota bacterium]|nr:ParB/RepB/Spo0J family partition protein [Pseudomonadota bacterium]
MVKKRLGRGLDALLGHGNDSEANTIDNNNNSLKKVKIELLRAGQYQPRKAFNKEKLQELADSIKAQGLIQPIVVRPSPGGFFEILAGERRLRAAKLAGLKFVSVIVEEVSDKDAMSLALIENIQREDLSAIEEAAALDRLVKEFEMSHDEIAKAVGRSRASVSNLIRLLGLPAEVKSMIAKNMLEMGHARALLGLDDNLVINYARKIVAESMSVRKVESIINNLKSDRKAHKKVNVAEKNTDLEIAERELSDYFQSKVFLSVGRKGSGKIVIHFSDHNELDGLLEKCGCSPK